MCIQSKTMSHLMCKAALSALLCSAIVGNGVLVSAADNSTTITTGRVYSTSSGGNTSALTVNGGTIYVDKDYATNIKQPNTANANAPNVWLVDGKIIVGQALTGSGAMATLTADNMTVDAGLVDVTKNSSISTVGDINLRGGTIRMSGTSGSTVNAANVNLATGANLRATSGLGNVINTSGAVNLKGGTITVIKGYDAALTIGADAQAGAEAGYLYVAPGYTFNAHGGTINAALSNSGKTNFTGSTTTVDNVTVAGGTTSITGDAQVNVMGTISLNDGTLNLRGGALTVQDGAGTLEITGGVLHSSAHVNKLNAHVKQSGGMLYVDGKSQLFMSKNLSVSNTGHVRISGGASLSVAGVSTLAANTVTVGDAAAAEKGTFAITKESLLIQSGKQYTANAGIAKGAIELSQSGTGASRTNQGLLILTGWNGEVDLTKDFTADAFSGIRNVVLGNSLSGNNVILMDATFKGVDASIDNGVNTGTVIYGAGVTVNAAAGSSTFTNDGTIVVPKLVAGAGLDEFINNTGDTTLVGTGSSDSTTVFNSFSQSGAGATAVTGGARLMANNVGISAGSMSIESASTLTTAQLALSGSGHLTLSDSTATIGTLKAVGGTLGVDSASVHIGTVSGSMDAKMLIGAGSVVAVGGVQGWLAKPMQDAGFSAGTPDQAVLGLAPTDTIRVGATGIVLVDSSVRKSAGTLNQYLVTHKDATTGNPADSMVSSAHSGAFWAGGTSLTVIDASGLKGQPVFDLTDSVNKTVNIADGAKLHITNVTVAGLRIFSSTGTSVTVAGAGGSTSASYDPARANAGWSGANVTQPDRMLNVQMTNTGTLVAQSNEASTALGMSGAYNGLMREVWDSARNNTHASNMGLRFVSRAASTEYGLTANQAARSIEGAAQMGTVAGVQGVTLGASTAVSTAVSTRTSFAPPRMDKSMAVAMHVDIDGSVRLESGLSAGNGMKNGLGLWLMPLYQSSTVSAMKSGAFKSGYNSNLGGMALGVDYTFNDRFRVGAALNSGAGYSKSNGDFNSTDNKFNFWGVNMFGGWAHNNMGLTADVGYTANYNKVTQDLPASLQMRNVKSDITSAAWNSGLKGEYTFATSAVDISPHVGVRYLALSTDQYKVKGDGTLFTVDQESQSIWTFPLGVSLSKIVSTDSHWEIKPQADFSVIPAAGDVKARSKSHISGVANSAEATMQVVDYLTLGGGLGLDVSNNNLSLGLNYNIQAAEHRTDHGVFGTVKYEF